MPIARARPRAGLDPLDHLAQVLLEVVARIGRERAVVDRGAVGDHHQDAALLGPAQALCAQRMASPSMFSLSSPSRSIRPRLGRERRQGAVGGLVDDVPEIVEPAGIAGLAGPEPGFAAWPPFQARVVKPRISTLTPQRSSVRARMSRSSRQRRSAGRASSPSCRSAGSRRCRGTRCPSPSCRRAGHGRVDDRCGRGAAVGRDHALVEHRNPRIWSLLLPP
jgi:hypothetical protein